MAKIVYSSIYGLGVCNQYPDLLRMRVTQKAFQLPFFVFFSFFSSFSSLPLFLFFLLQRPWINWQKFFTGVPSGVLVNTCDQYMTYLMGALANSDVCVLKFRVLEHWGRFSACWFFSFCWFLHMYGFFSLSAYEFPSQCGLLDKKIFVLQRSR